MPQRVADRCEVAPRQRIRPVDDADGYFFPHEAVSILGVSEINYRQLRALFELVRLQAGASAPRGWARFSLLDLIASRVALKLAGCQEIGGEWRIPNRLELRPILLACLALRAQGVDNPLLDLEFERSGRSIFAIVDGVPVDPVSSQQALAVTQRRTRGFLSDRMIADAQVSEALDAEARRDRPETAPIRTGVSPAVGASA